jgi:hypothetical protein
VKRALPLYSAIFLGCAFLAPARGLSWESSEENKPAAELQAMDEPTLAWEAQGPCVKAATTAFVVTTETVTKRRDALRYLAFILDTKRKKDGKVPPWLYELAKHAEQGGVQGCHEVASRIYLPPEAPAEGQAQEAQAQVGKHSPTPPTSESEKK